MTPESLFAALSDPTRLKAVMLIRAGGELCVCELTSALEEIQPKVSRHLAVLRNTGVVNSRRDGRWIHYSLNPVLPEWADIIIEQACEQRAADPRYPKEQQTQILTSPAGKVVCD